jgi:hypothetical protein
LGIEEAIPEEERGEVIRPAESTHLRDVQEDEKPPDLGRSCGATT